MLPATISSSGSTSSRSLLRAAAALVVALALAAPIEATAKKKVAVIDFKGPVAKAEKAVVRALKDEGYQIVGPTSWKAAEKKAKARGRGEAALAKTAKKAGVAAIVLGKIQKRGKKTFLMLKVHSGRDGSVIETVEVALKGRKIDKKTEAAVAQDLPPVVRRGEGAGGDDEPGDKPVRGGRDDDKPTKSRDDGPARGRDDDKPIKTGNDRLASAGGDSAGGDTPVVKKKPEPEPGEGEKRTLFSVGAGMSIWARSMTVSPSGAADTYKGQPVPGLRIDGDVYPVAAFSRNWAADFGIGFFLDSIWLKSEMSGGNGKLSTTQLRWGVDLRWRLKFTDSPTSPVLKAAFQVSQLSFKIGDRASAPPDLNIPNVKYMSYAPMVGIVVPLGSKMFQLGGMFGFLISSESGAPIDTATKGMPWGIELGLNFDFYPWPWLLTRAQFGLVRYAVKFTPTAPATATSMADMYIGGLISVGYVWH
jgi:hypothetical protein